MLQAVFQGGLDCCVWCCLHLVSGIVEPGVDERFPCIVAIAKQCSHGRLRELFCVGPRQAKDRVAQSCTGKSVCPH